MCMSGGGGDFLQQNFTPFMGMIYYAWPPGNVRISLLGKHKKFRNNSSF